MMGIINVTPDSFSDGGQALELNTALERASILLDQGVDVLDLGAESTRPGAEPISAEVECSRLLPVLRALRKKFPRVPLSIDTYKASVAKTCLKEGADLINDVEGARHESQGNNSPMAQVCAEAQAPLILMHRRREIITEDFWTNLIQDLKGSLQLALHAGVKPEQIWVDPGFGFGKTPAQNLLLIRHLEKITALGFPVLLGTSRKSTLGLVLQESDPSKREEGNEVTATWGIAQGCSMIRAHDFQRLRKVILMADALRHSPHWQSSSTPWGGASSRT